MQNILTFCINPFCTGVLIAISVIFFKSSLNIIVNFLLKFVGFKLNFLNFKHNTTHDELFHDLVAHGKTVEHLWKTTSSSGPEWEVVSYQGVKISMLCWLCLSYIYISYIKFVYLCFRKKVYILHYTTIQPSPKVMAYFLQTQKLTRCPHPICTIFGGCIKCMEVLIFCAKYIDFLH